jgi:hypothetical protein
VREVVQYGIIAQPRAKKRFCDFPVLQVHLGYIVGAWEMYFKALFTQLADETCVIFDEWTANQMSKC